MKRLFCTFGIIAASVASFTSCNKETPVDGPANNLVTVSFYAEKPGTKTAAVEGDSSVSYIWTEEDIDNIKLFTVSEDGNIESEVTSAVATKVSDNKMTISAKVEANNTYTFRAILCDPASYTSSGDYAKRKPRIKNTQSPVGTKNFDPSADILVSDDYLVEVGSESVSTDLLLTFRRKVVVNKMTLKNLSAGEKVSKVAVKSDKYLTGYLDGAAMSGQYKELSLSYNDIQVAEDGVFDVYFITMENAGQTLTVDVITDKYSYSKTFDKTIDFNLGAFTRFSVALPDGTPIDDISGYYLIGSYSGGSWQLMGSENSKNYYERYASSATADAQSVSFNDFSGIYNIDDYLWLVEDYDGNYSVKNVGSGKYLSYYDSGNNAYAVSSLDATAKFSVSISAEEAYIESCNVPGRRLFYNSSSPRFAFYTSSMQKVFMIPAEFDARTPVALLFERNVVELNTDTFSSFSGQSVASTPNDVAITGNITWEIEDNDGIASSLNPSTGELVLNGETGSATITASYAGDDIYRAARASYTVKVFTANDKDWVTEVFLTKLGSGYGANQTIEGQYLTWRGYGVSERNGSDSSLFSLTEALTMGQSSDNSSNTNYTYANFESAPIAEGISSLKFEYCGNGKAFKVEVVVDGSVVWSKEGLNATTTKQSSEEFQITGASRNAVIRFVNTSGSRRVTIGNISWK